MDKFTPSAVIAVFIGRDDNNEPASAPATTDTTEVVEMETIPAPEPGEPFEVRADRFADVEVLRYQVPGFAEMPLPQKKLAHIFCCILLSVKPSPVIFITMPVYIVIRPFVIIIRIILPPCHYCQ